MSNSAEEVFKFVIVGDGGVGKTSMLLSFVLNKFPTDYVPTVLETYAKIVVVNGIKVSFITKHLLSLSKYIIDYQICTWMQLICFSRV